MKHSYLNTLAIVAYVFVVTLLCVHVAQAQTTRQAILTWAAVTAGVDGSTLSEVMYNVYQGPKGAAKTKVAGPLTALTFTAKNLPVGEICWRVAAVAAGVEGAGSNEACKTFVFPAPSTTVLTVS